MKIKTALVFIIALSAILSTYCFIGAREADREFEFVKHQDSSLVDGYLFSIFRGFNISSTLYLVSKDGEVLKQRDTDSHAFNLKQTGNLSYPFGYLNSDGGFVYTDSDFNPAYIVSSASFTDTDIHDHILRDGTHFFATYGLENPRGEYGQFAIEQVDESGNILWTWNSLDHLDPAHSPYSINDWHHWNSMRFDGDSLILSLRNMNSVVSVNYPSGEVEWIFGGPENQFTMPIRSVDPDEYWFCAQHDVKAIGGTVTMFDNAAGCRDESRVVHYELDFDTMQVNQTFSFSGPYAFAMGSYDSLGPGSGLIGWGSSSLSRLNGNSLLMATEFNEKGVVSEFYWKEPDKYAIYNIRPYFNSWTNRVYIPLFHPLFQVE